MKFFTWAEIFCVGWAAFNDNCPNMEGVAECETNCETNFIECQVNCNGDAQCVSACNRIYATCEASCPCHDNCFEGQSFADGNITVLLKIHATRFDFLAAREKKFIQRKN